MRFSLQSDEEFIIRWTGVSGMSFAIHTLGEDIEEIARNYHGVWCRPINDSYVSRDFLRLANKFVLSVENKDGEVVEEEMFAPKVDFDHLVLVLNKLNTHVEHPKENQEILTQEIIKKDVSSFEDHEPFGNFLLSFYEDESKLVKILKCCNQTFVVLFLGALGLHLFRACQVRAKDVKEKGSWIVIVKRNEKDGTLSVIHRRKEQAVKMSGKMKLTNVFRFQWEIEMKFNKEMSHFDSISARVIDIEWNDGVEDDELETIFLTVFSDPKIEKLTLQQLTEKEKEEEEEGEEEEDEDNKKKSKKRKKSMKKKKKKKKKGGRKKSFLSGFLAKSLSEMGSNIDFNELFDKKQK